VPPVSIASRIICRSAALPFFIVGGAAVLHCVDQRQRRLAFGEVVADVLAELLCRCAVIERIIDELERLAEVAAVEYQRLLAGIAVRKDRADTRAGLEQLGRFAVDDLQIVGFGDIRVVAVHELQDFAFGDRIGRVGQHVEYADLAELHHHLKRARVQKIPNEHAGLVAEQCVGRFLAATQPGIVDDVVMEQRRRMNELHNGSCGDVGVALVARRLGRQQHRKRPEPLAAAMDDVMGDLVDESDVAAQALHDETVDGRPVLGNEFSERL
jgi:hypothetical protein